MVYTLEIPSGPSVSSSLLEPSKEFSTPSVLLSYFKSEMGSSVQKRSGLLVDPSTCSLPVVPSKESWAQCPVVKDQLKEITDKLLLSASIPFESTNEKDYPQYLTLFNDYLEGD